MARNYAKEYANYHSRPEQIKKGQQEIKQEDLHLNKVVSESEMV